MVWTLVYKARPKSPPSLGARGAVALTRTNRLLVLRQSYPAGVATIVGTRIGLYLGAAGLAGSFLLPFFSILVFFSMLLLFPSFSFCSVFFFFSKYRLLYNIII